MQLKRFWKSVKTTKAFMLTCQSIEKFDPLKMRDLRRRNAKWKQAGSKMETNGTHWKQNGCFVSNCFHCFFPQPARVREEACYMRREAKTVKKAQREITRGCLHVRQPQAPKT
jgi:hypothetical protein